MGVVVGVLMALYGAALMVWPYQVWAATAGLSFRTPQLVEPSERHLRYWRVSGSILVTVGAFFVVALTADGNAGDQFQRGAWPAAVGGVLTLVLFIRALRSPQVNQIDLPPDEPSTLMYGWWSLVFVVWLGMVAIGVFALLGTATTDEIAEEWVATGQAEWGDALAADLDVMDDIPPGTLAIPQGNYVDLNSALGVPDQLLAVADSLGPEVRERLDRSDLLLVGARQLTCTITGAVVREVEPAADADERDRRRVEVALLTNDASSVAECWDEDRHDSGAPYQAVLVDLEEPVGYDSVKPHPDAPECVGTSPSPLLADLEDYDECEAMAWREINQPLSPYFDDKPLELRDDD